MSKVITIFSVDSDITQAIVSTNIAISLYTQTEKETALCDFGLSGRDNVGQLMGLKDGFGGNNMQSKLCNYKNDIKNQLVKHNSGVWVLRGVASLEYPSEENYKQLISLLPLLKKGFDITIINSDRTINDNLLDVFDLSEMVLLIMEPHSLSINYTRKILDYLKTKHFPLQSVYIVLNRQDKNKKEIENIIGKKINWEIVCDNGSVNLSLHKNKPVVSILPHCEFSISIKELSFEIKGKLEECKGTVPEWGLSLRSEKLESRNENNNLPINRQLRERIHKRVISELNLDIKQYNNPEKQNEIKTLVQKKIEDIVSEEATEINSREQRTELIHDLLNTILGLGPLEKLLKDPSISEIMVNGKDRIYIEKSGKIHITDLKFDSNDKIRIVIDRILAPIGRRIDESSPLVDARLIDGSRVNVIIPPLSLVGPCITIRKFTANKLSVDDLIKIDSITQNIVTFLDICVKLKKNIIISGGTGSGKTTLLNMLSSFIPKDERIITIEDSAELSLRQPHVISLESKPPSIEGTGEINIRRLVINTLRMRPDRIIVGECRAGEALDMLQAMNTGHEGSLTTLHANSPEDAILRLTTMVMMAGTDLPEKAIKEQIRCAIDIIVQVARLADGTRKVIKVSEIAKDTGCPVVKDIFVYNQTGLADDHKIVGEFKPTGYIPSFYNQVELHGMTLSKEMFLVY